MNNQLVLLSVFYYANSGSFLSKDIEEINELIREADGPLQTGLQVQKVDLSGFTKFTAP